MISVFSLRYDLPILYNRLITNTDENNIPQCEHNNIIEMIEGNFRNITTTVVEVTYCENIEDSIELF